MYRRIARCIVIFSLLALAGYLWYDRLDANHKRFVQNLLRQLPELPGRYMI